MSYAEWCSPLIPVAKPDGRVRLCVDFRALNEISPHIRSYIPLLEEILDRLSNSSVMSK